MKASPLGKGETKWKMPSWVNFYLIVMAGKLFLMSFKEHKMLFNIQRTPILYFDFNVAPGSIIEAFLHILVLIVSVFGQFHYFLESP